MATEIKDQCRAVDLCGSGSILHFFVVFAVEDSCKWCCRPKGINTTCSSYLNHLLPEGMPCLQGYCKSVCHRLHSASI